MQNLVSRKVMRILSIFMVRYFFRAVFNSYDLKLNCFDIISLMREDVSNIVCR